MSKTTINISTGTRTKLKTLQRKYGFISMDDTIVELVIFWGKNKKLFTDIELRPTKYKSTSPASLTQARVTVDTVTVEYLKIIKERNRKNRGTYQINNIDNVVSALKNFHGDVRFGIRSIAGFHKVPKQE